MARLRYHFKTGTTTNNPLSSGATTINSAEFADLPAVTGSDTLTLVLDPNGIDGDPEEVTVTAHTAAATSVTVTRGVNTTYGGSAGRSHASGTKWVAAITRDDFDHGTLSGLGDDDHTQYLTSGRHDVEAHELGGVLGTPGTPEAVGTVADAGASTVPAAEDHVHALGADVVTADAIADGEVATAALAGEAVTAAKVAAAVAGNGLTGGAGTALAVGAGTGISVAADAVAVDSTLVTLGDWTDYTPTLTQSGSVTKNTNYAEYQRLGLGIKGNVKLSMTGAGTSGSRILVGLPVAAGADVLADTVIGSFRLYDNGARNHSGTLVLNSTGGSTAYLLSGGESTDALGATGGCASGAFALASGDEISYHFSYQAAA